MNLEFVLSDAGDTKTITESLADAITNRIRSGDPGDNSNATMIRSEARRGKVFKTETIVVVRWQWLILPILETLVAAVLLVISITTTRKVPLFETSTTALLAYPLSGWSNEEVAFKDPQSAEKLYKVAKKLSGKLRREEERLNLYSNLALAPSGQ